MDREHRKNPDLLAAYEMEVAELEATMAAEPSDQIAVQIGVKRRRIAEVRFFVMMMDRLDEKVPSRSGASMRPQIISGPIGSA